MCMCMHTSLSPLKLSRARACACLRAILPCRSPRCEFARTQLGVVAAREEEGCAAADRVMETSLRAIGVLEHDAEMGDVDVRPPSPI